MKAGIPFHILKQKDFLTREMIRNALAYLRLLLNPNEDLAFETALRFPKRRLGG